MDQRSSRRTKFRDVLVVSAGVALLAVMVFKVPLATVLLLGLWLVCPIMMMGMHGGKHGHGDTGPSGSEKRGQARFEPEDECHRRR